MYLSRLEIISETEDAYYKSRVVSASSLFLLSRPLRLSSLWKSQETFFVALTFFPSLLHFNLSFSIAVCSTSEIQRRSFCVCVCPVGIHVARQINNYRLTEYTTLQGEKKKTISGAFDVKHERDQNYTGEKKAALVCIFSLCWHCFLLLLCLVLWVCVKKKKKKGEKQDSC